MVKYNDFNRYNRKVQSLYNKFIIDPASRIIAIPIINHTNIKPYAITLSGTLISMTSAYLFYKGSFVLAAIIFQVSVILDGVDGYVARIKNNGSVFGILLDGYTDILRVFLNIGGLVLYFFDNSIMIVLLLVFLFLNFCESFIDMEFFEVERFLKRKSNIRISKLDGCFLGIKERLERYGLKTILFYYQERLFCVLFLGPVFNNIKLFTIVGIVMVLFSIHMKFLLDVALIKSKLVYKTNESLRFTSNINK